MIEVCVKIDIVSDRRLIEVCVKSVFFLRPHGGKPTEQQRYKRGFSDAAGVKKGARFLRSAESIRGFFRAICRMNQWFPKESLIDSVIHADGIF